MTGFAEYDQYDATGLAALVREGEVKPIDLLEEAITRVNRYNPRLNAVIHPMFEEGRRQIADGLPEGPFTGVPFLLKDLLSAYKGHPIRSGCRFLKNVVADHDTELVKRYKGTGVVVFGKTNTPEFGLVGVTEPELFGPTLNPWDLRRTPGGSSGGSGSAVAARLVPMASGGDGGGSIRIPSSCCGLFGMKPTRARTPTGPHKGELWGACAVEHVLTRSVRDSATMLDAVSGPDPGAPFYPPPPERPFLQEVGARVGKLKIAFSAKPFVTSNVRPEARAALESSVELLRELGHELIEDAPRVDGKALGMAFLTMLAGQTAAEITDAERLIGKKATRDGFETETWLLAALGRRFTAADYCTAMRTLRTAGRVVGRFFHDNDYDVLVTPTLARAPVKIGELKASGAERKGMELLARINSGAVLDRLGLLEPTAEKMFDFTPFTFLFNVSGNPGMSVPLHWDSADVPIGTQFVGRYADEATLYRLAGQLEEARPWEGRRPKLIL